MKRITLYTLLIAGIAVQATCKKDSSTPSEPEQIAQNDSSKKKLLCRKWQLVQIIAGNSCGTGNDPDTTNYSLNSKPYMIWELFANNTYVIYTRVNDITSDDDSMNIEKGQWAFNLDFTVIGKNIYEYNGKAIQSINMSFEWHIVTLNKNELKIRFQGRGGNVYYTYVPVEK